MALILAAILLEGGSSSLISFLQSLSILLPIMELDSINILDYYFMSILIPVITLSIAGILLYRSSLIRKLLKK
jgi:hypothetical protein